MTFNSRVEPGCDLTIGCGEDLVTFDQVPKTFIEAIDQLEGLGLGTMAADDDVPLVRILASLNGGEVQLRYLSLDRLRQLLHIQVGVTPIQAHINPTPWSGVGEFATVPNPDQPRLDKPVENVIEGFRHIPARVMLAHLLLVADIAHVVPCTGLVDVLPEHRLAGPVFDEGECLQDRAGVITPTAAVVDLGHARGADELLGETCYIVRVDVIADLLTLVSVHPVDAVCDVDFH